MLKHERYVVKSKWQKVLDNIKGFGSAILIALAIRVFLIEPYKIPTPSMYPTILEGDMVMANKFFYGVRIPVINLKLPAFSSPEVGNIALFETPTYESPGKFIELMNFITFGIFGLDNTADNPKYFIKRIVATPGDILTIYDPRETNFQYQLEINSKKIMLKPAQFKGDFRGKASYDFFYEDLLGKVHLVQYYKTKYKNSNVYFPQDVYGTIYTPKEGDVMTFTLKESHDNLKALKEAKSAGVSPDIHPRNIIHIIVNSKGKIHEFNTTGKIIKSIYFKHYQNTILSPDDLYNLILESKVIIKEIKDDYYFAIGDNRDNSHDSRFWGFVNHSLLLGNPLFRHYPFSRFGKIDRVE